MDGALKFKRYQELINSRLSASFTADTPQKTLTDAMRYSLLAGGKRIRPALVLGFCEACGGDVNNALNAALAVEMLHTYSLIHDDLPCMDDDELRRGRPTNHVVFGECMATLAGDALQAAAFAELYESPLPADAVVSMGRTLAHAAGWQGMCGGQTLDMQGEGKSLTRQELQNIHELKTAAMLRASALLGVYTAGGTQEQLQAADAYAVSLGLAFQIRDDMLDLMGEEDKLGKPVGSDRDNEKFTFATLCGLEECGRIVEEETERAIAALGERFTDPSFPVWLARSMAERSY